MFRIRRARHPGLVVGNDLVDHPSAEFVNVRGWLTNGDVESDSGVQCLAVPENRFIPAKARSTGHQLRSAGLGACLSRSGSWRSCLVW